MSVYCQNDCKSLNFNFPSRFLLVPRIRVQSKVQKLRAGLPLFGPKPIQHLFFIPSFIFNKNIKCVKLNVPYTLTIKNHNTFNVLMGNLQNCRLIFVDM